MHLHSKHIFKDYQMKKSLKCKRNRHFDFDNGYKNCLKLEYLSKNI